jgi:hypothetical protein
MSKKDSGKLVAPPGVKRHSTGLILVLLSNGKADGNLAQLIRQELMSDVDALRMTDMIIEASLLDGYEGDFIPAFADLLTQYKAKGGGGVRYVAKENRIRALMELVSLRCIKNDGPEVRHADTLDIGASHLGRSLDGAP